MRPDELTKYLTFDSTNSASIVSTITAARENARQVREQTRWALAVDAPTAVQPAVPRITVTLPFLNAARVVIFLVAGNDKRPVMREILDGAESAQRYPAALVAPRGRALWMIDRSAMPDERSNG